MASDEAPRQPEAAIAELEGKVIDVLEGISDVLKQLADIRRVPRGRGGTGQRGALDTPAAAAALSFCPFSFPYDVYFFF
jgi:hypothetical protein